MSRLDHGHIICISFLLSDTLIIDNPLLSKKGLKFNANMKGNIIPKAPTDLSPVEIDLIKCPSIRDLNGMSLSSRYSSFTHDQKIKLAQCASIIKSNLINLKKNFNQTILDNLQDELKGIGISKIDYCELRNEDDLNLSKIKQRSRLFLAFYINKIRVIDNFILY